MYDPQFEELYKRKFTTKEFLTRIYNRCKEKDAEHKVNELYWAARAKLFKAGSAESNEAKKKVLDTQEYKEQNTLTLEIVGNLLALEDQKEAKKN